MTIENLRQEQTGSDAGTQSQGPHAGSPAAEEMSLQLLAIGLSTVFGMSGGGFFVSRLGIHCRK